MILQSYLKKLPKRLIDELPDFTDVEYCKIRRRNRKRYKSEVLTIYYKNGTYDIIEIINRDYYVSYGSI